MNVRETVEIGVASFFLLMGSIASVSPVALRHMAWHLIATPTCCHVTSAWIQTRRKGDS